ncbi:hypothetical protein B0H67DRAFT_645923 [Lasiosphaeris hirsuta]|uniref:Uncharacterized protein n=1 Tax=Lasiosphaeris hirsuta TaxID=260670 RepID=A0AA40AI90_9PEZI|nr:hypothetical protein B0H67DRAFT_645923 [Lasiosphaeris hirsuta]
MVTVGESETFDLEPLATGKNTSQPDLIAPNPFLQVQTNPRATTSTAPGRMTTTTTTMTTTTNKTLATSPAIVEQDDDSTINSTMWYLEHLPLYETEKPYTMRYKSEDDIPQTNFKKVQHPMKARSMREPGAGPFHLDECGFHTMELRSRLTSDEFWDNDNVQGVYIPEVKEVLKRDLGVKYVHVLDYALRKRDQAFLLSTWEEYEYDQPTALAHIDFTIKEGERIVRALFGDRADEVLKGRWQAIK